MDRPRLSWPLKLAYASGQAGNVLGYQLISTFILPLYTPPDGKGFHNLIPPLLFGIATFGWLNIFSRGVDTFFDPFIANLSDRSAHPSGRRRVFMLRSALPLAVVTGLVFFPPSRDAGWLNTVWLGATLLGYYCLFSAYVAPYLALLPELCPDKDENTQVSTLQAAGALLGAMAVTAIAPMFIDQDDPERRSLQIVAGALAALSFVLLAIPLIVDERKLVTRAPGESASHVSLRDSLRLTFSNRSFLSYVLGSTLFFFGFTVVQTAAPFFVEVLLGRPMKDLTLVYGGLFGVAGAFFFAVPPLQQRFGKRRLMIFAALSLALVMGVAIPLIPSMPHPALATFGHRPLLLYLALPLLTFALAGVPVALFLALPNAMVADIAQATAVTTGERREGMFFGAQGFLQKIALGVAASLVSQLHVFGKSVEHPLGVQLAGPLAAVALVASAFFFWRYPEARVQQEMEGRKPVD